MSKPLAYYTNVNQGSVIEDLQTTFGADLSQMNARAQHTFRAVLSAVSSLTYAYQLEQHSDKRAQLVTDTLPFIDDYAESEIPDVVAFLYRATSELSPVDIEGVILCLTIAIRDR